ncbi:hypothetical protein CLOP_g9797 [Closterium sp. NIES-67]|nr:hypothetical protein CLOP_g9797 [Closterium sp. NIES-67]
MMASGAHKPAHHRQASQAPHPQQQQRSCEVVTRLVAPFALLLLLAALLAYLALSHAHPPPALLLASNSLPPPSVSRRDEEAGGTMRFDGAARVVRLDVGGRGGGERKGGEPRQDERGWMIDPVAAAASAGLKGGATSCLMTHVGRCYLRRFGEITGTTTTTRPWCCGARE